MRARWRRFSRFNLIGLLGAGVQLAAFSQFARIFQISAATALAVELALLHNFVWHECFTWGEYAAVSLPARALRLCRFHAANGLISILGNTAVTYLFAEWPGIPRLAAEVAGIAICAPLNFWFAERWVYAPAQPQPQAGAD